MMVHEYIRIIPHPIHKNKEIAGVCHKLPQNTTSGSQKEAPQNASSCIIQ